MKYEMRTGNTYKDVWTTRLGPQLIQHHEYREFRWVELKYTTPEPTHQCAVSKLADYEHSVTLACTVAGATITDWDFASWGTASGECAASGEAYANDFKEDPQCSYSGTAEALTTACIGKPNCTIVPSDDTFGHIDPCDKVMP